MCHISDIQTASSELPAFIFVGSVPLYKQGNDAQEDSEAR